MTGFTTDFARSARKELERLPAPVVERVMRAVGSLRANPRPRGVLKLEGEEATYRLRVGQYRVVYEIEDERRIVLITRVRHRKDAYRK